MLLRLLAWACDEWQGDRMSEVRPSGKTDMQGPLWPAVVETRQCDYGNVLLTRESQSGIAQLF